MPNPATPASHDAPAEPTATPTTTPRRWPRRVAWGVGGVVLLLLLLVAAGPVLLSTGPGNGLIKSFVNAELDGSIEAEAISIGWFTGPRVSGFELKAADGQSLARFASLDAPDASLMRLLGGSRDLGDVRLSDVSADIQQRADGSLNILEPFSKFMDQPREPRPSEPTRVPESAAINFELRGQNTVTFAAPDMAALRLDVSGITLNAPNANDIKLALKAAIRQGDQGGAFSVDAQLTGAVDRNNVLDLAAANIDAAADLSGMPIEPVDRLLRLDGALRETVGPVLHGRVEAKGGLSNLNATVLADSEHTQTNIKLAASDADADANPGGSGGSGGSGGGGGGTVTRVPEEGVVKLTLTPKAFAAWRDRLNLAAVKTLPTEPVEVTLTITRLSIGQKNGRPDLAGASVAANATVGPMRFQGVDAVGDFSVKDSTLNIDADQLGRSVGLTFATTAQRDSHTGSIKLDGKIAGLGQPDGSLDPAAEALDISATGRLIDLPIALADHIAQLEGLLVEALGPQLKGDLALAIKPNAPDAKPGTLSLNLTTAQSSAELSGNYAPGTRLVSLSGPVRLNALPELIAKLQGDTEESPAAVRVDEAVAARFDLATLQFPLGPPDPARSRVAMNLTVQPVAARVRGIEGPVKLDRFTLDVPEVTFDQVVAGTLDARLTQGNDILPVNATVKLFDALDLAQARAELTAAAQPVSVVLIDRIAQLDGQAIDLLGERITAVGLDATARLADGLDADGTVTAKSDRVDARLDVSMSPQAFTIKPGGSASLQLDAAAAQNVMNRYFGDSEQLKVTDPLKIDVAFKGVTLPRGDGGISLPGLAANVDVVVPFVGMEDQVLNSRMTFKDVKTVLATERLGEQVRLATTGGVRVVPRNEATQEPYAPIDVLVNARGLFDDAGKFSTQYLVADLTAELSAFPVAVADHLAQLDGLLLNTLGNEAELNITGTFPGKVTVDGSSDYSTVSLPLEVDRELRVTLGGDSTATLQITPRTTKGLLGDLHPAFGDALGSDEPVKLTIFADGFEMPMGNGFDVSKVKMRGRLDAGTIRMSKAGWVFQGLQGIVGQVPGVGVATNLLSVGDTPDATAEPTDAEGQAAEGQPEDAADGSPQAAPQDNAYRVRFSPMDFTIDGGVVDTSEMWITSDTLATGFQGKADLVNNKVQMVMGVLGASLISQQLGVHSLAEKATIRLNQIIDIPVGGTLDSPSPDVGYVTLQLAGAGARKLTEIDPTGIGTAIFDAVGGQVVKEKQKELGITWTPPKDKLDAIVASAARRINVMKKKTAGESDSEADQAGEKTDTEKDQARPTIDEELERIGGSLLDNLLDKRRDRNNPSDEEDPSKDKELFPSQ